MPNINEILARPANKACSIRGADMGRPCWKQGKPERLHLQRLRFVDGDYDTGGAYWGSPANVWCAFSPDTTQNEHPIRVFVRANSRQEAKNNVLELLPGDGWTFFR